MEAMGVIGGGAIVVKKYQASATVANAGVMQNGAVAVATNIGSVTNALASTILATGTIGLGLDTTGTVAATGITDTNDILVSVAVNPDLIIKCKMTAGATEDTALAIQTTTGASAGGTVATGVTSLTQGILWGYDGANKGEYRRTTNATGTVGCNFPKAISIGDRFLYAPAYPAASGGASLNSPDMSTLLTQCDAQTASPGDNDYFQTFDVLLRDEDDDGANNSFWLFVQNQNAFGSTQTS